MSELAKEIAITENRLLKYRIFVSSIKTILAISKSFGGENVITLQAAQAAAAETIETIETMISDFEDSL